MSYKDAINNCEFPRTFVFAHLNSPKYKGRSFVRRRFIKRDLALLWKSIQRFWINAEKKYGTCLFVLKTTKDSWSLHVAVGTFSQRRSKIFCARVICSPYTTPLVNCVILVRPLLTSLYCWIFWIIARLVYLKESESFMKYYEIFMNSPMYINKHQCYRGCIGGVSKRKLRTYLTVISDSKVQLLLIPVFMWGTKCSSKLNSNTLKKLFYY